MKAVTHLKTGKSDGSGLSGDHFIHGNAKLYVHVLLSIVFTLFLRYGFSQFNDLRHHDTNPQDKKKSLWSASNYRAIALSSILSKIVD